VTSVIRAFGKAGWTLDEARAFFVKKEIEVADTTIKIQLRAGVKGEGGEPASFTKDELASMKPKVAKKEKSEKGDKSGKSAKTSKKSKKSKTEELEEEEEEEAATEEEGDEEEVTV
jgi:hypothetical protein